MGKLLFRSALVLALRFGFLIAVGMVCFAKFDLWIVIAVLVAVVVIMLQWLIGPTIIGWLYAIKWSFAYPELNAFVNKGWYRRAQRPYFEMRVFERAGEPDVNSYFYPVTQLLVYGMIVAGMVAIAIATF